MIILVDADGVMENLTKEMTGLINEKYGTNVVFEEMNQWGYEKWFPTLTFEQIFSVEYTEELYDRIKPIEGAEKYLKLLLEDGHDIYVVTNTPYGALNIKMKKVMEKYFPFITWDKYIITSKKQLVKGDVLIDDGVHNLIGGSYRKLLFDAPCNRDFCEKGTDITRVFGWKDAYETIRDMILPINF